jgi:Cu+-exporting ATPase
MDVFQKQQPHRGKMKQTDVINEIKCFHCGQDCEEEVLWLDDHAFCCHGCQTVYEILAASNLCEYYDLDKQAGVQLKQVSTEEFRYLDEPDVRRKLIDFESPTFSTVTFFIPSIHCVSCIWLLENLHKLNGGVIHSEVNFVRKTVRIDYNTEQLQLSAIATLITSVGYAPKISLEGETSAKKKTDNTLALKVAVAGFCFGNVMLFSFPEYLGLDHSERDLMRLFSWLNLTLSIPVFFYSGFGYVQSAMKTFRQRQINIDVPIAAGLMALFFRSSYDIITATGPGYLDSFTGLVFFLLIGRWFQSKTYESLAFDRDFTAYFPLAVNRLERDEWKPVIIYKLRRNDTIRIRNMELIPADSILTDESAWIDYSFVTGEARPVKAKKGDVIYAGGRLIGSPITCVVEKATSQSQLTSLWNNDVFKKTDESKYQKIIDRAARKFTWIVLAIAFFTAVYWHVTSPDEMWIVLTCVLMVACPCALALAAPFTLGSMLRVMGANHMYLKNADVIERMATIDTIVFDKTGTVTHGSEPEMKIHGDLSDTQLGNIKLLTGFSTHPLSIIITRNLRQRGSGRVSNFRELPGQGIEGTIDGRTYRIGSADFTAIMNSGHGMSSKVFVSIDGMPLGYFTIKVAVREHIAEMLQRLGGKAHSLLSGDHDTDKDEMRMVFGKDVRLLFNQTPQDKLAYIRDLQREGRKVMMIGDGLNDAGALKQSDVGIAVTDDTGVFTPACDGILFGERIISLDRIMNFATKSSTILKSAFAISFFYNAAALSIAVSGHLSPLTAAIIMPVSSISVVGFSSLAVRYTAWRLKL